LPGLMAAHDVFVAPCVVHCSGRRDGIPNTVIEALSQGLPVVASRVNALPEVVRHGQNGLLVPPGDAPALAEALCQLAEHPDEIPRMGAAGLELAREMFAPERNSRLLADIFIACHRCGERRGESSCAV